MTPSIDGLAASGILLDQCFVDSQCLASQLASLWTGRHALQSLRSVQAEQAPTGDWNLWQQLASRHGQVGRLFTDSEQVAEAAEQWGCESVTLIKPTWQFPANDTNDQGSLDSAAKIAPAEDSSQCALMELFAAVADELSECPPGLIWMHSRGFRLPWDAPLSLRTAFMDPDDPQPPQDVYLPSQAVDEDTDPDVLVGWSQVAAAQAAVVDEGFSALRDKISQRADAPGWSWLLASLGGTPLGEHGWLGWNQPQLHGEELHVAAIILPAERSRWSVGVGTRRPELFQLPDLAATLAGLLDLDFPQTGWGKNVLELGAAESPTRWPTPHCLAMIATAQQTWLRTPAWSALFDGGATDEHNVAASNAAGAQRVRLWVKPEDRWEVSEIADRRRAIAERLSELVRQFHWAVGKDDRSLLPALDDELSNLLR